MSGEKRELLQTRKGRSEMNRKTITAAILAAAMLTVMTGCGGQDSTGTVSTAAPSESSTPAEPAEQNETEPAE